MRRIFEVVPLLFSRGGEMRILSFITVALVIDRIPRHFESEAAVVIAFEIVVEAAKHISEDFRLKHSEVPWRDMAGMRDKLTHDYFGVDLAVLWKTVQQDAPMLGRPKKPSLWGGRQSARCSRPGAPRPTRSLKLYDVVHGREANRFIARFNY